MYTVLTFRSFFFTYTIYCQVWSPKRCSWNIWKNWPAELNACRCNGNRKLLVTGNLFYSICYRASDFGFFSFELLPIYFCSFTQTLYRCGELIAVYGNSKTLTERDYHSRTSDSVRLKMLVALVGTHFLNKTIFERKSHVLIIMLRYQMIQFPIFRISYNLMLKLYITWLGWIQNAKNTCFIGAWRDCI